MPAAKSPETKLSQVRPPRVRTKSGCYEQRAGGQYRWIPPGGALREYDLGHGYSATPGSSRRSSRWLVSNGTNSAYSAPTLHAAARVAASLSEAR